MDELHTVFKTFLEEHIELHDLKILEIGAGDGKFTSLLNPENNEITATDITNEELVALKKKLPSVTTRVEDATKLSFADKQFDVVVFSRSLHHIPIEKIPQAVQEAIRVLKDDGHIIIVEPWQNGEYQKMEVHFHDEVKEREIAKQAVEKHLTILQKKSVMTERIWNAPEEIFENKPWIPNEQRAWIREQVKPFTRDGKIIMTSEYWFAICKK